MSQKDLARHLGTSQSAVYRLENPRYDRHSVSTLKKIAEFFDVGLIVRFAAFSEIAAWALAMSDQAIDIPDFDRDTGFIERKPQESAGMMPRTGQPSLAEAQWRNDNLVGIRSGAQLLTQQSSPALVGYAGAQR
jgi:transcriptional regulator with XRE-family HTH domain